MADLMFRKGEYDQATFHFQQLLERSPGEKKYILDLGALHRALKPHYLPDPIPDLYSRWSSISSTRHADYTHCTAGLDLPHCPGVLSRRLHPDQGHVEEI